MGFRGVRKLECANWSTQLLEVDIVTPLRSTVSRDRQPSIRLCLAAAAKRVYSERVVT